jgi:hypothetical protein
MGMNCSLTELPYIGKAIATDLNNVGIHSSSDLEELDPLSIFEELRTVMGNRHDPCVYYTLLSVKHFLRTGESLPWWKFTEQGKIDLQEKLKR